MKRATRLSGLLLVYATLAPAGCNTKFVVKVEMLKVKPAVAFAHPSTRMLVASRRAAEELSARIDEFFDACTRAGLESVSKEAQPGSDDWNKMRAQYEKTFHPFVTLRAQADKLTKRTEDLLKENADLLPDPSASPEESAKVDRLSYHIRVRLHFAEIRQHGEEVRRLIQKVNGEQVTLTEAYARFNLQQAVPALKSVVDDRVGELLEFGATTGNALEAAQTSFAGYVVTGVYVISAADPMYHQVLAAKPYNAPFAQTAIFSLGDTIALIVFDDPVRVRLHQIRNDPEQLLRNATMIIDKALLTVAKYATIGP
jgi:hypothetical protein